MKFYTLLFTFLFSAFFSSAQFTLDQNHFPTPGEVETYIVQATGLDVENAGPDQTWNMAFISGGEQADLEYGIPEDFTSEFEFPSANLVEVSGQFLTYMEQSETELNIVGINIGDQAIYTYSDPLKYYEFQFDYLDSYSDDYFADISVEGFKEPGSTFGTYEVTYDAYGTLELPYGTLENTARRVAVNTLSETFDGNTVAVVSTVYTWYVEDYAGPVASYIEIEVPGQNTQRVVNILTEADFSSLVETHSEPKVSVYPNPSVDVVNVEFPSSKKFNYTIADAHGKTVITGTTEEMINRTLTINGLETGMYILHASNGTDSFVRRFIVE